LSTSKLTPEGRGSVNAQINPLIPLTMFNLQEEIKKIKAEKRQAQANGIILGLAIIGISISYSALLIMFLDL
jgi:hypothetical protein